MRTLTGLAVAMLAAGPADACHVGVATTGVFAAPPQGRYYTSSPGGLPAALTITNVPALEPAYHVSVQPPSITAWGDGFAIGSATVEIAYTAVGVGVAVNQAFTNAASGFDAPAAAAAVVMTFHSRIVSASGYTGGDYGSRVVVTCG